MSTVTDKTGRLFKEATHSDEDPGYPYGVTFVPGDEPWTDESVRRNLEEGYPTLVVGEEVELLLTPRRRGPIDRLRRRMPVDITTHVNGRATTYAVASRLGHRPVLEMLKLASNGAWPNDAKPITAAR